MTQQLRFPKARLEKYFELDEERKKLEREAKSLKKQQDEIEQELGEFTEASGGKVEKYGFMLYFTERLSSVPWKQEFIRLAGDAAAEKLISAQDKKKVLVVDRTK